RPGQCRNRKSEATHAKVVELRQRHGSGTDGEQRRSERGASAEEFAAGEGVGAGGRDNGQPRERRSDDGAWIVRSELPVIFRRAGGPTGTGGSPVPPIGLKYPGQ